MKDNPHSLRYRIFGPIPSKEPGQEKAEEPQVPPRSPSIAARFKAAITKEIPECISPKRRRVASPDRVHHKCLKISSGENKQSKTQPQCQIHLAAKLKDSYAERCGVLHQVANSRLEETHKKLQAELRTRTAQLKKEALLANSVADRIRPISQTKVQSSSPGNREPKVLVGQLIENHRTDFPRWEAEMSRLETELPIAKKEVLNAFQALFDSEGGPGTALYPSIKQAKENIRRAQDECIEEMNKLKREVEDELCEKEKNFDAQIRQIQEFVGRFLHDDGDGSESEAEGRILDHEEDNLQDVAE